jgi:hypothetical protein
MDYIFLKQKKTLKYIACADEDRIAGGYDAQNNKPWIAKVWLIKDQFLCGGTLINKRYSMILFLFKLFNNNNNGGGRSD